VTGVFAAYLALGAVAGLLAGLLGVGGGLVVVPGLAALFAWQGFPADGLMHLAVGTSLAAIVFTATSSALAHHRRGAVLWGVVVGMAPGAVVGTLGGAMVAAALSSRHLRVFFGHFELAVAVYMLVDPPPRTLRGLPGPLPRAAVGALIGAISALAGIAGGTLTVPWLASCRVRMHQAVATSAGLGLPIALAGSLAYALSGTDAVRPDLSLGYVYLPAMVGVAGGSVTFAPLGAHLAHRLSTTGLRRAFAGFLVLVGLRMLVG
jgi:hypothetical protein